MQLCFWVLSRYGIDRHAHGMSDAIFVWQISLVCADPGGICHPNFSMLAQVGKNSISDILF